MPDASMVRRPSTISRLKTDLALLLEVRPWLPLVAFIPLVALIGLPLVLAAVKPAGPSVVKEGHVLAFGLRETEKGSFPVARVALADRTVTIRLRRGLPCAVGDRIRVRETPTHWGRRYSATLDGCTPTWASRP